MKRSFIAVLLSILAVATIFATVSCKGKTVFGKPYIPNEPGLHMDFGYGFDPEVVPSSQEVRSAPGSSEIGDPLLIIEGAELENITPMPFKGSRIIIAARLTPSEIERSATIAERVAVFCLYPLSRTEKYEHQYSLFPQQCEGGCYVCSKADIFTTVSADKSDYKAGYIYLEISNIPPSPTDWYAFYYGNQLIFLQQNQ